MSQGRAFWPGRYNSNWEGNVGIDEIGQGCQWNRAMKRGKFGTVAGVAGAGTRRGVYA
jgi:hypothetical protein